MDAAASMIEKAIIANPTYAEAYNNLGPYFHLAFMRINLGPVLVSLCICRLSLSYSSFCILFAPPSPS